MRVKTFTEKKKYELFKASLFVLAVLYIHNFHDLKYRARSCKMILFICTLFCILSVTLHSLSVPFC